MIIAQLAGLTATLVRLVSLVHLGFGLVPMDTPSPSATREPDVYPTQGHGFAADIVPALFGLAVIALLAIWLSSKPKRRRR